ncbi:MAG: radical SAM protein [Candidatus Diapherotrites archaeon]|nr:radical SAM protein [Candidatus Diapherotrites archaeon]
MLQSKKDLFLKALKNNGPLGILNIGLRTVDARLKPARTNFVPFTIQIDLTTNCNLKCKMCEHTYWKEKNRNLSLKEFKKIIDNIPSAALVNLTGRGENLMNPEIFKMIEYAKSKNIYVWFNDNMTLMHEANAKKVIDLGLDCIAISFDGATKKTYEHIRNGANFEKTIKNIKRLQELKKEAGTTKPELFLVMIVMKENYKEMPRFVELAKELEIPEIVFAGALTFKGSKAKSLKENPKKELEEINRKTQEKADELGIKITLPLHEPKAFAPKDCSYPWTTAYIDCYGNVIPCCFSTQRNDSKMHKESILGNAISQKFAEVWNSEKYIGFRKKLLSKDPPLICKTCERIKGYY